MKKLLLPFIVLFCIVACTKNKSERVTAFEVGQHPTWTAEPFKTDYTIQFPSVFFGLMVRGFEGNIFFKERNDTTLYYYLYSNNLRYHDFRDTLHNPSQASIQAVFAINQAPVVLSERIEFTSQGRLQGVFYYNNLDISFGRLFWKDSGYFKEAMDVRFRITNLGETIDIIRSIKHN